METSRRKDEHLRISHEEDVSFDHTTSGFECYHFIHQALPELDLEEIDTSTTLLGRELAFPLLIASMTGGTKRAGDLNRILAEIAQEFHIGMGLGSMRAALEQQEYLASYQVRTYAPDILLLANLGAVQLNYGYGPEECRRAVESVGADALYLHLNPLQEALQPGGDTHFSGLLRRIEAVCAALSVPVIVKEVGWGLSPQVARQLADAGVAALDVAGAGGTSWSQVEMYRSEDEVQREVAASFRDWGIPTAVSLQGVREALPDLPLIASGGLRTGIDIAKALALGAEAASLAGEILKAATRSPQHLRDKLAVLHRQLRITMFVTGAADVAALRKVPLLHLASPLCQANMHIHRKVV